MLRERGLTATFFVVGTQLREHRALAERARDEGHRVGNHTLTHPRPLGALGERARAEIEDMQALMGDLGRERLFRPSGKGGDLEPDLLNDVAIQTLTAGGYTCVLWNAVPRDWEDEHGWVDRALREVASRDWTLLVLHDVAGAAAARLEDFLDRVDATIRADYPPDRVPIQGGV